MRKNVLITGVAGFIGSYVARHFIQEGFQVVGLDSRLPEAASSQHFHFYQCTLPSKDLGHFLQQFRPQVCIHCAGPASVDLSMVNPDFDFNASVPPTFNLLESLRLHAPECRLVYLSSAAVYGNPELFPIKEDQSPQPISPYGFHKLVCEQICLEFVKVYGLRTAIVRIFSAYGVSLKRQVLWDICRKALTEEVLKLKGTGNETRDFIHIQDVARAIYILVNRAPFRGEVYNLANGVETMIRELADLVLKKLGRIIPVEFDGGHTPGNPLNWLADISRIKGMGFIPESTLDRGVQEFAEWCKAEVMGR